MILLIDIGNSFVSTCCMDSKIFTRKSIENKKSKFNENSLRKLLLFYKKKRIKIETVVICSVVPNIEKIFLDFFKKQNYKVLFVNEVIHKLKLKTKIIEERKIGSDRLVNVFYTVKKHLTPALIVDFGTATTFDYINENDIYEGGLILPGINLSLHALNKFTAKLPLINFEKTKELISNYTEGAICSGFYWGYICMIEGLIKKIRKEKKLNFNVILTGGNAKHFQGLSFVDIIDSDLTMKGLYLINEKLK